VEPGVADELVEVGEAVRPVERVGGVPRLRLGDPRPVDGGADDPGMGLLRHAERGRTVRAPAEGGVVLEADQHPRLRRARGRQEGSGEQQCGQGDEEKAKAELQARRRR